MAKVETITSAANPLLKDVRRAIARGGLTDQGWCVAESLHLLDEAFRGRAQVKAVLAAESATSEAKAHIRARNGIRLGILPDELFQSLAATENSQGVMALVSPPEWTLDDLFRGVPLVLVLDGLQDPGNAGASIRAAEAFGATGAIFLKGTVSPYNPKTLRASAGSLFRLPFLHGVDAQFARAAMQQKSTSLYAAIPGGAAPAPAEVDLARPCSLIIGSEAHGVSEELRGAATDLSIPTTGVESLNAAVAAGILLYEARRQRARLP